MAYFVLSGLKLTLKTCLYQKNSLKTCHQNKTFFSYLLSVKLGLTIIGRGGIFSKFQSILRQPSSVQEGRARASRALDIPIICVIYLSSLESYFTKRVSCNQPQNDLSAPPSMYIQKNFLLAFLCFPPISILNFRYFFIVPPTYYYTASRQKEFHHNAYKFPNTHGMCLMFCV